jgi:hypothetical protein
VGRVLIAAPGRCIRLFALTVVGNVKFHFGQQGIALSTAASAGLRTEDRQERKTAIVENIREKTVRGELHRLQ